MLGNEDLEVVSSLARVPNSIDTSETWCMGLDRDDSLANSNSLS